MVNFTTPSGVKNWLQDITGSIVTEPDYHNYEHTAQMIEETVEICIDHFFRMDWTDEFMNNPRQYFREFIIELFDIFVEYYEPPALTINDILFSPITKAIEPKDTELGECNCDLWEDGICRNTWPCVD